MNLRQLLFSSAAPSTILFRSHQFGMPLCLRQMGRVCCYHGRLCRVLVTASSARRRLVCSGNRLAVGLVAASIHLLIRTGRRKCHLSTGLMPKMHEASTVSRFSHFVPDGNKTPNRDATTI